MPMPTAQEGVLEVNKQYQEVMKIVINLVTASLVLPVVFLKNILGVESTGIRAHLCPLAYLSWVLLGISLSSCLAFYFWSTKFAKAVYQGQEKQPKGIQMENRRDVSALVAAPSFVLGLVFLMIFFLNELSR
jgi:hypothetical protein